MADEFERKVIRALDADTDRYDREVADKLALARQQALQAIPAKNNKYRTTGLFAGVAAALAILLVAGFIFTLQDENSSSAHADLLAASMEVILSEEEMAIFESDLEFYQWLEQEQEDDNAS